MSGPKVLIIDTYYNKMLKLLDDKNIGLAQLDWEDIYDELLLGTGFSYNHYLKELGVSTNLLVANNSKQYGSTLGKITHHNWSKAYYYSRIFNDSNFLFRISPLHQSMLNFIENTKPDVLFIQDINLFPNVLTSILKSRGIKLVGEIASPLPPRNFFHNFDLVISSLPSIVSELKKSSVNSRFLPLAFDARINSALAAPSKQIAISFVGSFSKYYTKTIPLLKSISKVTSDFKIFGSVKDRVLIENGLDSFYAGEAWGLDMFRTLQKSKIVINRHIDMAGDYAANMRMFEVTGVGSLLLTDFKSNLNYYFDIDTDLLSYKTPDEAASKAARILNDEKSLDQISRSGQQATLSRHTYQIRAEELSRLIQSLY